MTYGSPAELLIINLIGLRSTRQIRAKHMDNVPLLFLTKELGFPGRVGKEEERSDGNNNGERALDEEDPRPSVVATELNLGQTGSQQTTKRTTERSGTVENLRQSQFQAFPVLD
jgi:hypothetical protein